MPKASHDALQDANFLMCASLAADVGLPCDDYSKIALVRPSRKVYKSVIADTTTDEYTKLIKKLEQNPRIYLSSDKSNSEKGGSKSATLPKLLTFFDLNL